MSLQGYSSAHESWFTDQCVKLMFKLMTAPKSRHFQPELGKALKDSGKSAEETDGKDKDKSKGGKKRGGPKAKAKRKSRKSSGKPRRANKKRKAGSDEEGDEPEDEENDDGSNMGSGEDEDSPLSLASGFCELELT